jgi:hypothetical protein
VNAKPAQIAPVDWIKLRRFISSLWKVKLSLLPWIYATSSVFSQFGLT